MAQNPKTSEDRSKTEGLYPIRTVSSLTGVNSITLRAWERRYGLIKPVRTPKGHRLYTQNDIDLIQQVLELLDKGISIGQVKDYLKGSTQEKPSSDKTDPWSAYQRRMLNAIVRFDVNSLDSTYNDALSLYPVEMVTKHLILPLLKTLGTRWESAEGSVAEEHFFGAYLRNKLGARFHHHPTPAHGPTIVAACMPGEQHEIGLMLFCLAALTHGYRIIYLGADTPLDEIAIPVERSESQAVLLSGSLELQAQTLSEQLPTLITRLKVPVFIGGSTAVKYRDAIVDAGAIPLGTDIQQALRRIDEELEPGD
jgi:DNA-binding transcriptional MerR regulator/methylmalonyl-CoA mutase cobalamin-binding subunit